MTLYPGTSLFPAGTAPFLEDGGELPPSVTTGAAVITGATTASLAGSINPNTLLARYLFEYGFTAGYGSSSAIGIAGTAPINVLQGISGIDSAANYHYRLIAWSAAGTSYGLDRTFTGLYGPVEIHYLHEAGKGQY